MTNAEVKELLQRDEPLWVRLTGSNRIWRYGGLSNGRHTALHQQDGLVRYFIVDEVTEVLHHIQPGDAAVLRSNWLAKIGHR